MTPERWEQIGRLYQAASELPGMSRAAFLRDACGDDHLLRQEVESLLASEASAGTFLNAGALSDAAAMLAEDSAGSLVGKTLGIYEVRSLLGSGGMGEVYRAHDSRLARDVALKVLPAIAAPSESARKRFNREAQAVAALSHPNIRSLYDVGEADGRVYAVMELLDGETLRARLVRGPLPWRKAIETAAAIADGLAAAHARGIVHRDLKPENIFITAGGHMKILDFGLAKVQEPIGPDTTLQSVPGLILGTAGYLSPEQVSGNDVDGRSDIFSLGCVLYEMVSGRRAFERTTVIEAMSAVVNQEPPESEAIGGDLGRVVAHCLEKQPDARFQSARDLVFHLRSLLAPAEIPGSRPPLGRKRHLRLPWLIAVVAIVTALGIAASGLMRHEPTATVQSYLLPPENAVFCHESGIAISPDGLRIAYAARAAGESTCSLWIQPLAGLPAQRIAGTEGARFPFWSPDSRSIGFFSGDALLKTDASGSPQKLCSPCRGQGTWNRDGIIVFGNAYAPLRAVPAAGGDPFPVTELTTASGERGHSHPVFLPDGRHLLFRTHNNNAAIRGIYSASLDSKEKTLIARPAGIGTPQSKVFVAAGHVLFIQESTLMAAPFDVRRVRLTGNPSPVAATRGPFSVSDTGTLIYSERPLFQLAWVDRTGRTIEDLPIRGDFYRPKLSHDGRRVALSAFDERGAAAGDIWVYDIARRVGTRITADPAYDTRPVWSSDDEWIVFLSERTERSSVYRKRSTGVGQDELVFSGDIDGDTVSSSPDGRFLIVADSRNDQDLWQVSLPEAKATRLTATPFSETDAQISPDGKWVVYTSDETGQPEIYVQPFPPSGARWLISTGGGRDPRWRGDGRELFYADANAKLMSVELKVEPSFEAGVPRALFDASSLRNSVAQYDVSADGQRFLIVKPVPEDTARPITLVQNWMAKLKK